MFIDYNSNIQYSNCFKRDRFLITLGFKMQKKSMIFGDCFTSCLGHTSVITSNINNVRTVIILL